ncbi:MAG TPA: hypothetical protein VLL74_00225, partial [Methanoregula sp.]|nr:hypothetical protein [Methanoregula sp.]
MHYIENYIYYYKWIMETAGARPRAGTKRSATSSEKITAGLRSCPAGRRNPFLTGTATTPDGRNP